jgi:hypothetical protein
MNHCSDKPDRYTAPTIYGRRFLNAREPPQTNKIMAGNIKIALPLSYENGILRIGTLRR